jgi:hypothetical protein
LLRVGRQELNYGSGRLVSVRDGNNSRQYFTGLKLSYIKPQLRVDAFILATSRIKPGLFDNVTKIQGNFWGAYSELSFVDTGNFDIYYLGIMREQARFEAGAGRELRHTVAVRYWKDDESFKYNLETAYQFGKFSQGNIRAWTMAIELGYTFSQVLFKPSFALRNDYVSGDHNISDNELNSFNPLYPKGGYFGFNPLIGPSNLIDIHPYATLHLTDKLSFQFDLIYNWRYSVQDGLFGPSGSFNFGGSNSSVRYIGTTYLLSLDYQLNKYFSFGTGYQYFRSGPFIQDIISNAADSKFFNTQLSFKF